MNFVVAERPQRVAALVDIGDGCDLADRTGGQRAGGVAHGQAEDPAGADLVGFGQILFAKIEHAVLVQCAAESGGGQGVERVAQLESEDTGCDGRSEGNDVEREHGRWASVLVNLGVVLLLLAPSRGRLKRKDKE